VAGSKITQHNIVGDPISNLPSLGSKNYYKPEKLNVHSLDNFLIKIEKEAYAKASQGKN
jgi:hypothetical protein